MEERGFQLLDCMLVCLVLGGGLSLGMASLDGVFERYRLQWAGYLFASEISTLRSTAVGHNLPVSVSVNPSRTQYGFATRGDEPSLWRPLPRGVVFVDQPATPVTFYSRGNAVPAGSYLLANSVGRMRVVVAPTGRVRWEILE
jgi:Tfp pilus assembly protein FimT